MSELFNQSINNVIQHIKAYKNNSTCEKNSHVETTFEQVASNDSVILPNKNTESYFSVTGSDGKTYNVKHYNQDIILQVGYKCNIGVANRFKEWVD